MFYAEAVLSKKGPLAKVWLAAHWERKLTKAQLLQADIPNSVDAIVGQGQGPPLALRLSGQLLLGVSRIYARKARYLLEDCNEALIRIKMAFRPGAAEITSDTTVATHNSITLPEALTEFDILLPSRERVLGSAAADFETAAAMNTSRLQDITLAEQSFDVSAVARGVSGIELDGAPRDEPDLLGRDDDFRLDIDDDFVFSPPAIHGAGPEDSLLEPEVARDAMRAFDESIGAGLHAEAGMADLLAKEGGDLPLGDIAMEDATGAFGDSDLRLGGDESLGLPSALDASIIPNTQEAALQEVEAQVLAASRQAGGVRAPKRRRLNLSELVTNEATSLSPNEIRERLSDPADILRVPVYLPPTDAVRLEDVSSAAVASRFIAGTQISAPFSSLFERSRVDVEQEVPGSVLYDSVAGPADDFRVEGGLDGDGDDAGLRFDEDFGAESPAFNTSGVGSDPLLAYKSPEQIERLEEESFQRQEQEMRGGSTAPLGVRLFGDEDIAVAPSQLSELAGHVTEEYAQEQTSQSESTELGSGYSKNTIRAVHLISSECNKQGITPSNPGNGLSYFDVAKGAQRSDAVKLFFELLVLKTKDFVDVKQVGPFEDIAVAPKEKLVKAADSIGSIPV